MASKLPSTLPPTAESAPQPTGQPAQKDDSKINMSTTSESTKSQNRAATAPPQEQYSTKEREDKFRAQSLGYPTHLEQARHPSQPPSNRHPSHPPSNRHPGDSATPATAPLDDASATIMALRQEIYIAEQHIMSYRHQAGNHISQLEDIIRTSWDRSASLEANVNYLIGEVQKANTYNGALNDHVHGLLREAETREMQHRLALQAANAKASAASTRASAPPPLAAMQDSSTLLKHNRTTIRTLRAEIRDLKAGKKQLHDRVQELCSAPVVDGSAFFQNAGLPREVLDEWSQVLLGRERERAGLLVMYETEREAR